MSQLAPFRAVTIAALAAALAAPGLATGQSPPAVSAPQAYAVQPETGDVLFRREADSERPIASTTKLMTALVVLERVSLADTFTAVPYSAAAAESRINLRAGERMTVRDLLVALLLASANDAAATLAEGTSGSQAAFVDEMNAHARALGLRHTHFANPIGLDDAANYSSAADLAQLTLRLRRNAFFRHTVDRRQATLRSGSHTRVVGNRNSLLGAAGYVNGVKTGHTQQAGYVLVGSATGGGVSVVSVVLGEPGAGARDADTLALLRWGLARYRRVAVVRPDRVVARAAVKHRREDRVELVPARRVERVLRRGERAAISLRAPRELEGPLPQGARVGSLTVRVRGRVVATVPLVTAQPVPKVGLLERAGDQLSKPGTLAVVVIVLCALALLLVVGTRRREGQRA